MKNTLTNKARFFAVYWNQRVLKWDGAISIHPINESTLPIRNQDYLELKSIDNATEEDAKYLADHTSISARTDYLRSKGYLIPFNGVDEQTLISWGWAKLKE